LYIINKMSKCLHGKIKRYCKECDGSGLCIHNKQKHTCKECGGASICQHKKIKNTCKECGGSSICQHGKQKSQCKECNGSALCEHNNFKKICKDCKGSALCEHGNQKRQCKECGGSAICKHGKQKSACRECGGSAFCQHDKYKSICKECSGSALCQHGKQKTQCIECNGTAFCQHNIYKNKCKECGGSALCQHEKQKTQCKECGGSSICQHKKVKYYCKICDGKYLCKSSWCETIGNLKYNGYCLPCCIQVHPEIEVSRNYKTKEKDVVDQITQAFPSFTWVADKKVQDGCSRRRPDLLLDMGSHIIIMEVDENKHTDYDCSCEHKRLMELSQDLQHRPIIFIRFNPDDYVNQEDVLVKSCWKLNKLGVMQIQKTKQTEWEERINSLKQQIQYWIDNPTEKTIEIVELFY
jgi:hypothetical protein